MANDSNVIGSLLFCPECGNLLNVPGADDDIIMCNQCSHAYHTAGNAGYEQTKVVTTSSEHAFQSTLKAKRSLVQQSAANAKKQEATIQEKCPQCGNNEMAYYTMQLRSADEGQTVFYNCKKCGYKYSINN
ncbi:transcription factor S-II-domain-containing protein [Dichotomocladium elegans]|nr:transcription factor S-II-domain-containing protein [Dichotomocladium elegans]